MKTPFLALLTLGLSTASLAQQEATTSDTARATINAALSAALQAQGEEAYAALSSIDPADLSATDQEFAACMIDRLDRRDWSGGLPSDALDDAPQTAAILALFRDYWSRTVSDPADRDAQENALREALRDILEPVPGANPSDTIIAAIEAEGLHAIAGRTGRLLDLIVWREQREVTEHVLLQHGIQQVTVNYLDQFSNRGWSNFLSCDRSGTGGWATKDALFVITPAYDSLTDEAFQVSYLKHEAQHFSDFVRLPDLEGWELEYRAKLTELAFLAEFQERTLRRFAHNQGDDPSDAHSYANAKLMAALVAELGLDSPADLFAVSRHQIQSAARNIFVEDTAARTSPS